MSTSKLSLREQVEQRLTEELARGTWDGVAMSLGPDTDPAKVADYARALHYLSMIPEGMQCDHPQQDHCVGSGECWCKCGRFVPDEMQASSFRPEEVWAAAVVSPVGYRTVTSVYLREEDAQAKVDEMTEAGMRCDLKRLPINYLYPGSERS